jgi:glycosyltransferase involved in cell wall biosynthesis
MNESLPPTFCYFGPPIDQTHGGSALLFKLLRDYPADRFVSVELQMGVPKSSHRLEGMKTITLPGSAARLNPRLRTLYELTFHFAKKAWAGWLDWKLRNHTFEAVVCVMHGWICEVASELAKRRKVPFHAVLHDHAGYIVPTPRFIEKTGIRRWVDICRRATTRLCVSPYMAAEVEKLTGRAGVVLYPGLSPGTNLQAPPMPLKKSNGKGLTFVFIGMVHAGYKDLVLQMGRLLKSEGHQFILHSPQAANLLKEPSTEGMVDGGWIPTESVAQKLRETADVLFLPMSFKPEDVANMTVSFPSKLVEYCAAGLPVLIWGPDYCSAVRWAREHPGFAEVVETGKEEAVIEAIRKLADATRRQQMGKCSLSLARDFFTHEHTFGLFLKALENGSAIDPKGNR